MTAAINLTPKLDIQAPSLTIVEQPVEFYRYRYESEITGDRVGGLLLGRGSSGANKSFIRGKISGIHWQHHRRLQLTVCTANHDRAPHPYYLHGDSCQGGFYRWDMSVDERTPDSVDVSFDRLAVICISKTPKAIKEGLKKRKESVPALVSCPEAPTHPYDGRNLGRIRLAFTLSFHDAILGQEWTLLPTFSDEISDTKQNKSLVLDELNPSEVSPVGGSEIAIYVKNAATGISLRDATVHFVFKETEDIGECSHFVSPVTEVKKHLLLVTAPDVTRSVVNDRTKASVTVHVGSAVSTELSIVFARGLQQSIDHLQQRRGR